MTREAVERPFACERQDGAKRLLGVLLGRVVGDVLAEALLVRAEEADDGGLARELGADDVLVALELVGLDDERQVETAE